MKHTIPRRPPVRFPGPILGKESVRKAADSFALGCLRLIANHGATGADIQKMVDTTKEPDKRMEIEAAFGRIILKQLSGGDISGNAEVVQFPISYCPHGTPHRWPCEECDKCE